MSTSITKTGILKADGSDVGENLLSGSLDDYNESHTTYGIHDYPFTEALGEGKTYTISIKINMSSEKKSFGVYHSGGTYQMGGWQTDAVSEIYKYSFVATAVMASQTSSTYGHGFARVYVSNNNGGQGSTPRTGTANVDWIKIEEGPIATPWTPNPNDDIYTATENGFFEDASVGSVAKGYFSSNEFYEL